MATQPSSEREQDSTDKRRTGQATAFGCSLGSRFWGCLDCCEPARGSHQTRCRIWIRRGAVLAWGLLWMGACSRFVLEPAGSPAHSVRLGQGAELTTGPPEPASTPSYPEEPTQRAAAGGKGPSVLASASSSSIFSAQQLASASSGAADSPAPPIPSATTDSSASEAASDSPVGPQVRHGSARYYRNDGGGSCALPPLRGVDIVAVPRGLYQNMQLCGACLVVEGPGGSTTVQVADLCPGCAANVLDLNTHAYRKVSGGGRGNPDITWEQIRCPLNGGFLYVFKRESSRFWAAFQVRNHACPIRAAKVRAGESWVVLERSADNHFVLPGRIGNPPITLQLISMWGQVVEETISQWYPGQRVQWTGQFR
jgi:expansin (peptidoglycan-binding protein)